LSLPLLCFFAAWAFGTVASANPLAMMLKNTASLYVMGFSMLIGISRVVAAFIVDRFAARFIAEQDSKKTQRQAP
jgi:hypothetical protein